MLIKFKLEIGYDPIKFIVQIRSLCNKEFKLVKVENDLYTMLGFNNDVMNKAGNKFRGRKMADMKVCKQISINIANINNNLLGKVNVNQSKIISNLMIMKPFVKTLNYIDLVFTGENGRPYWFNFDEGETFSIHISIKGKIVEDDKNRYINKIIINEQ